MEKTEKKPNSIAKQLDLLCLGFTKWIFNKAEKYEEKKKWTAPVEGEEELEKESRDERWWWWCWWQAHWQRTHQLPNKHREIKRKHLLKSSQEYANEQHKKRIFVANTHIKMRVRYIYYICL